MITPGGWEMSVGLTNCGLVGGSPTAAATVMIRSIL
jgi:hypothetical protein